MHNQTESRRNFLEISSPKFINCPMRVPSFLLSPKPTVDGPQEIVSDFLRWPIFEPAVLANWIDLTGKSEIRSSPSRFHEAREIKLWIHISKTKITNWLFWRGQTKPKPEPRPKPQIISKPSIFLFYTKTFDILKFIEFKKIHKYIFYVPSINRSMMSIIDWAYD